MSKKRRRKEKVYYNSDTDTWSNGAMEQPYLMPGTASYEAMQEANQIQMEKKQGDEFHEELEEHNEKVRSRLIAKGKAVKDAFDTSQQKFKNQRAKERMNDEIEDILEDGLGKDVNVDGGLAGAFNIPLVKTCDDELYDDSITPGEYKKAVIRDYEKDFADVCKDDKDHDGEEDEWTPGMKKLSRYM